MKREQTSDQSRKREPRIGLLKRLEPCVLRAEHQRLSGHHGSVEEGEHSGCVKLLCHVLMGLKRLGGLVKLKVNKPKGAKRAGSGAARPAVSMRQAVRYDPYAGENEALEVPEPV